MLISFTTYAVRFIHQRTLKINPRLLLPSILLILCLSSAELSSLTLSLMADAFWQVSTYVALTLLIYGLISQYISQRNTLLTQSLQRLPAMQIPFAACMGALPGCGGAIVIITQYVQGKMSFGSVVAVLTATMGDAAFLLLAAEPKTGLLLMVIGVVVGIISGWIIDHYHGVHFLRPTLKVITPPTASTSEKKKTTWQHCFWVFVLIPAAIVAISGSLQWDLETALSLPANSLTILGAILALIMLTLWAIEPTPNQYSQLTPFQRSAQDTNFVTSWVIWAFLSFELTLYLTGFDLTLWLEHWEVSLPLIAILIGLLPGCGPQILTTSLYLSGGLPLSAQIGNAISNDGDALFPAIALAPKAAFVATLYSTIPALLVAYGYFWLFE